MTLAKSVECTVAKYGSPHTLRKGSVAAGANAWTQGTVTPSFAVCTAKSRHFEQAEVRSTSIEHGELFTVSASSLPDGIVPEIGDKIAPGIHTADAGGDWRQVLDVYATYVAGVPLSYRLKCSR